MSISRRAVLKAASWLLEPTIDEWETDGIVYAGVPEIFIRDVSLVLDALNVKPMSMAYNYPSRRIMAHDTGKTLFIHQSSRRNEPGYNAKATHNLRLGAVILTD